MYHHVIMGYGYCGYYLAQSLRVDEQRVSAICRSQRIDREIKSVNYCYQSVLDSIPIIDSRSIIYYLIPPIETGKTDQLLREFLQLLKVNPPAKVIYVGSSAVYGDYSGEWVDETSDCKLSNDRQFRRFDAEQQWQQFCHTYHINYALLRVAGIYGPERLPLDAVKNQQPVITTNEAPYTNTILVHNLVNVIKKLAALPELGQSIFNVADGQPNKMGYLQQQLATILKMPLAPEQSFEEIWQTASPMKKEFMTNSKRLCNHKLIAQLGENFTFTSITQFLESYFHKTDEAC